MSKIYSKNPKTGPNYLIQVSFTPHENWHKQLNWSSLVQFWGFIVMRCLIISSLSDTLWLSTASYTTFIAFPPLPNLLFLEQLPLPITTRAHTGIWIGGGFFFLTNDLTNNSASAKERGPHHFFLSPLMECVCLSGLAAVSLTPPPSCHCLQREEETPYDHQSSPPIFICWHFISETSFHLISY